jgi:hypothetical protein
MPKITVYKVPALDKGKLIQLEKQGYAVNLYVGDVQERFMLQLDSNGAPDCLVHYATGQKFGDTLNSVKVRNMLAYGHAHRTSDRAAANQIIAETIARIGLEKVRDVMRAAPVINA